MSHNPGIAGKVHARVIDDVLKNIRMDWLDKGVDAGVLDRLRANWMHKLEVAATSKPVDEAGEKKVKNDVKEEEAAEAAEAPEKKLKRVESEKELGEESLSSLTGASSSAFLLFSTFFFFSPFFSESSDDEVGEQFVNPENLILCQFETVKKTKNQWKAKLRNGVVMTRTPNGIVDYRFTSATATLTRW